MTTILENKLTFKKTIKFAFPSIIMLLFTSIYTIIDGLVATNFINSNAFAAISIFYPILGIIFAFSTMFGTGATAHISAKIGQKKEKEARSFFSAILIISFILGIIISTVSILFIDEIIIALGANSVIFPYCKQYAIPIMIAFPFIILQVEFQFFYAVNGTPKVGLFITILGGVINIILDLLFTLVFNFGIIGISIASIIGYITAALSGIVYFLNKNNKMLFLSKPKIKLKDFFKSMLNGSSEMITNLAISITTLVFNLLMMQYYGEDGVSAMGIILNLDYIFISSALGFTAGIAPLISYCYGKKDTENIKKLFKYSILFSIFLGITITILVLIFRNPLVLIYEKSGTTIFNMAIKGIVIFAFCYIFKVSNVFYSSLFTSVLNGKISAVISIMRTLVFTLISIFSLVAIFGIDAIWYTILISEFLSFLFSWTLIITYRKKYSYY